MSLGPVQLLTLFFTVSRHSTRPAALECIFLDRQFSTAVTNVRATLPAYAIALEPKLDAMLLFATLETSTIEAMIMNLLPRFERIGQPRSQPLLNHVQTFLAQATRRGKRARRPAFSFRCCLMTAQHKHSPTLLVAAEALELFFAPRSIWSNVAKHSLTSAGCNFVEKVTLLGRVGWKRGEALGGKIDTKGRPW